MTTTNNTAANLPTISSTPGVRTQYSPFQGEYEIRDLRPIDGSPKVPHVVFAPEASVASTVRVFETRWGTEYRAKINGSVCSWSPLQGGWICPL